MMASQPGDAMTLPVLRFIDTTQFFSSHATFGLCLVCVCSDHHEWLSLPTNQCVYEDFYSLSPTMKYLHNILVDVYSAK